MCVAVGGEGVEGGLGESVGCVYGVFIHEFVRMPLPIDISSVLMHV